MVIHNLLITWVSSVIAWGTYPVSLVAWTIGRYKPPLRLYRVLRWLEGQRVAKCRRCGFGVRWNWSFCPSCGGTVQETLVQEIERHMANE